MADLVLVATPARTRTPEKLVERCEELVRGLSYGALEWRLYPNEQAPGPGKYSPNARARNELIELYLRDEHRWVLWWDVDVIEAPVDLVERLMGIAWEVDPMNGGIVAPMVYVEQRRPGPVNLHNGGWFYDTGGYMTAEGVFADAGAGLPGDEELVEMASVGCVYLAPAALYRAGGRYRPVGDEVEHLSFCREARRMGARIVAARSLRVTHAYLPEWGESWH